MAEGKKSFIVYTSWFDFLEELSNEQMGMLFRWVLEYCNDKNPEYPDDAMVKMAIKIIQQTLKADLKKYEDKCKKNLENARKRWDTNVKREMQTDANKCERNANAIQTDSDICNMIYDNCNMINDNNKENIRVINNTIKENAPNSRFSKPSVEEIKAYCDERGNNIDPYEFYDFYESKNWFVGKNKMKDWKACIRTWERKRGFKPGDNDDDEKIEVINGKRYVAGFEIL